MKKSYAKKLGLCVVLALSAGVLLPTGVVEAKNYTAPITGDSHIDGTKTTYKGDATVRYAHDTSAPTTIYGGNVTIASASSGSIITATTDNNGIDTTNSSAVNSVLNALKNKLIYSASDTNLTKYA